MWKGQQASTCYVSHVHSKQSPLLRRYGVNKEEASRFTATSVYQDLTCSWP